MKVVTMIPYVRQGKIYNYIRMKNFVYLDELVEFAKVSLPTVRRDLKKLEDDGKILLLNGGGVKLSEQIEHSVDNRLEVNSEEKYIIGAKAAHYVDNNDFIYLGPGTTENYLISFLSGKDITVVTNGIFHVKKLVEYNIKTILIGGQLENTYGITYGPEVYEEISKMNFTTCIIGASGVSEEGISSFDKDVSIINRKIIEMSKKKILIVDSTKLKVRSHFIFADINDFTCIITTDRAACDFKHQENFVFADRDDI